MPQKSASTILTVEDDLVLRKGISSYLRKKGFRVLEADDGAEALKLFRTESPDLILSDLCMPNLDGLELLSVVREENANTPFIMLSGIGTKSDVITALRVGAWDYLVKPLEDMGFLYHAIDKALERACLIEEAKGYKEHLEKTVLARTFELERQTRELEEEVQERKTAEIQIAQAKKEWENTFDAISDIITIQDKDMRIVRANKAAHKFFQANWGDLNGKYCYQLFSDTSEPCPGCPMLDTIEDSGNRCKEITHKKLGKIFSVSSSVILTDSGDIDYLVHFARDITEQKKFEEELSQAHKMEAIGTLAGGIAHEINTPTQYVGDNTRFLKEAFDDLNPLLLKYQTLVNVVREGGATEVLLQDIETTAESIDLPDLLEEIPTSIHQNLEGVKSISKIVRSMKEFSHPSTEEKSPVDINRAIESTITVAQNEWKYVAEVKTEFDTNLPPVPCFQGELNQVILNMIINAAHAISDVVRDGSNEKGVITVQTRRDGDWAEIRIADTGTGIPEENRTLIFNLFFTTKEVGKGTGQGLAISHSVIVEKHGGELDFETQSGKGTTFIIRLPLEG